MCNITKHRDWYLSKNNFDKMPKSVLTKAAHNDHTYSLRLNELKEEVGTCVWRQNLQNDDWKSSVENPDIFSLAEFGFWFVAKRSGSLIIKLQIEYVFFHNFFKI